MPYGLCGSLTGNSYRETDQSAGKIIEEWSQFYPLDKNDGMDANKMPPLVEVIVGEYRHDPFFSALSFMHTLMIYALFTAKNFRIKKKILYYPLKQRIIFLIRQLKSKQGNILFLVLLF